jgi:ribosomal-protein-alanine N-acetyltransferase
MAELHSIETPRLLLRPPLEHDVAALHRIQSDCEAMRFTYCATSLQDTASRLRAFESLRASRGFAPWVVIDKSTTQVIGWGGLGVDPFEPDWGPEVSYWLDHAHWGRGVASELVLHALAMAFETLRLPSVSAFTMPANAASARVLEKCGFRLLGYEPRLERNHYVVEQFEPSAG